MVEFLLGEAMTATLMGSRHLVSQLEVANQLLIGSLLRRSGVHPSPCNEGDGRATLFLLLTNGRIRTSVCVCVC